MNKKQLIKFIQNQIDLTGECRLIIPEPDLFPTDGWFKLYFYAMKHFNKLSLSEKKWFMEVSTPNNKTIVITRKEFKEYHEIYLRRYI